MSGTTRNHLLELHPDKMTAGESGTTVSTSRFQQVIQHVGSEPDCLGLNPDSLIYGLYGLGGVIELSLCLGFLIYNKVLSQGNSRVINTVHHKCPALLFQCPLTEGTRRKEEG